MTTPCDTTQAPLPWVIVGYGRIGQTLKLLADRIDADIHATWNRTRAAAEAASVSSPAPRHGALPEALASDLNDPCVVWLTVVDDAICDVYTALKDAIPPASTVVHTSGSLPSTALSDRPGHSVASLHPLQAVSDPNRAIERFPESFWTIEGDDHAVRYLRRLIGGADIEAVRIDPEAKTLYHASAVTAANLMVSLVDAAIAIADAAGIEADTARSILVDLAESNLHNLKTQSPRQALTGPVARGDSKTIAQHRRALDELDDDSLREIYDILTRRAVDSLTD